MREFVGTLALVFSAIVAWWFIGVGRGWWDVSPSAQLPAPEPSHVVTPSVTVDLKHVTDIISAANQHVPMIIIGFVVVLIAAMWALVRVVEINARRPPYEPSARYLEGRREELRGNLPAKTDRR